MPKKPPKIFLKKYKEDIFNKKIITRTFIEDDKEYLLSIFLKDDENIYSIKKNLLKDDIKRLEAIAKSIKKNTGIVEKGKLIVFTVIIGAVSLFYIFFKDTLLSNALETSLVSIFQAKSNVSGLSFDIFGAKITIKSCTVGDSTKPFRNLVELGKTEIDLNMTELLKGKFVVTNIECQDIRFGTERTESAVIDNNNDAVLNTQKNVEETNDGFALDIKGIDTQAIIDEQLDNLKSPGKIEEVNQKIDEMTEKWTDTVESFRDDLEKCDESVNEVTKINIKKIKTIAQAENAYRTLETAVNNVSKMTTTVNKAGKEMTNDSAYIEEEIKLIEEQVQDDYDFILSFVKTPDKGVKKIFSSVAEEFLKANLGEFYTYGMKGIDVLKNINMEKKEKEKKNKTTPGKGYKLQFPGNPYPNFMIENAAFSVGDISGPRFFKADIKNISSAPDLTSEPSRAAVIIKEGNLDIAFDGFIDIRKQREEILSLSFKANGYPLTLDNGLGMLGISNFKADVTFSTDFSYFKDNKTNGKLYVLLENISLDVMDNTNEISKNISQILTNAENVFIDAGYSIKEDSSIQISAESNVDELIAERVGEMIEGLIDKAKNELKKAVNDKISVILERNKSLSSAFKVVEESFEGDRKEVDGFNSVIDKKKKEIDAKKKELEKGVVDGIKDLIPGI